jgi:hypothetical protein
MVVAAAVPGHLSEAAGEVLAQGHDGQEAHDADEDDGGLEHAGGDKAERDGFVLPLDHREQRHRGAAGQGVDQRGPPRCVHVRFPSSDGQHGVISASASISKG